MAALRLEYVLCAILAALVAESHAHIGGVHPACTTRVPIELQVKPNATDAEPVVLKCGSNEGNHLFYFWYFQEGNSLIGPNYNYSTAKYRFEALSGNLKINDPQVEDQGYYNCVSRGVTNNEFSICSIKLSIVDGSNNEDKLKTSLDSIPINQSLAITLIALICVLILLFIGLVFVFTRCMFVQRKEKYAPPSESNNNEDAGLFV